MEEEEPKIYINNRTNSWAVVGRVGGVVKVLTKEEPSVESTVVPEWVKEAMKGEEEEEGEGEGGGGDIVSKKEMSSRMKSPTTTPASVFRNNSLVANLGKLLGA